MYSTKYVSLVAAVPPIFKFTTRRRNLKKRANRRSSRAVVRAACAPAPPLGVERGQSGSRIVSSFSTAVEIQTMVQYDMHLNKDVPRQAHCCTQADGRILYDSSLRNSAFAWQPLCRVFTSLSAADSAFMTVSDAGQSLRHVLKAVLHDCSVARGNMFRTHAWPRCSRVNCGVPLFG
eukprot:IDg886t1